MICDLFQTIEFIHSSKFNEHHWLFRFLFHSAIGRWISGGNGEVHRC